MSSMPLQLTSTKVKTGEKIKKTGKYVLGDHVQKHDIVCKIFEAERMITLTANSIAPPLLSCNHGAEWILVSSD